ncbi:hypothetical protein H4R34_003932 [Dimargaris verticillata]|uniref:Uncharacterized protein n=1 Tax=Dimargaris verticillata TaxID=2761393 RepID=A0A9W8B1E7_9FUNG|nr:hypothetical protein H4R34_003932 [Dimargaris verticillata]
MAGMAAVQAQPLGRRMYTGLQPYSGGAPALGASLGIGSALVTYPGNNLGVTGPGLWSSPDDDEQSPWRSREPTGDILERLGLSGNHGQTEKSPWTSNESIAAANQELEKMQGVVDTVDDVYDTKGNSQSFYNATNHVTKQGGELASAGIETLNVDQQPHNPNGESSSTESPTPFQPPASLAYYQFTTPSPTSLQHQGDQAPNIPKTGHPVDDGNRVTGVELGRRPSVPPSSVPSQDPYADLSQNSSFWQWFKQWLRKTIEKVKSYSPF